MEEIKLFLDVDNKWVTNYKMLETLQHLGANDCDILYIHSALTFGIPNPALPRQHLLQSLFDVIMALEVKTVCMPTFTFSFCNKRVYDPDTSPSKMGVLNEYFRNQNGVIRSKDPLMSVALIGQDKSLVEKIGQSSIGSNSTFDNIRHKDNVKFLFLGAKIGDCFTYMHYLEWLFGVDYRYDRKFLGEMKNQGLIYQMEYDLFVRYMGVYPNHRSYLYEQKLYEKGCGKILKCGNSTISIVNEKCAAVEYRECLNLDPYYFVDLKNDILAKDKTFVLEQDMVAL